MPEMESHNYRPSGGLMRKSLGNLIDDISVGSAATPSSDAPPAPWFSGYRNQGSTSRAGWSVKGIDGSNHSSSGLAVSPSSKRYAPDEAESFFGAMSENVANKPRRSSETAASIAKGMLDSEPQPRLQPFRGNEDSRVQAYLDVEFQTEPHHKKRDSLNCRLSPSMARMSDGFLNRRGCSQALYDYDRLKYGRTYVAADGTNMPATTPLSRRSYSLVNRSADTLSSNVRYKKLTPLITEKSGEANNFNTESRASHSVAKDETISLRGGGELNAHSMNLSLDKLLRVRVNAGAGLYCDDKDILRRAKFRGSLDAVVITFNREGPKTALDLMRRRNLLTTESPLAIANFLFFVPGLDKKAVGEYLGHRKNELILRHYIHLFEFTDVDLIEALRVLFSKFHPPGESQQLFRVITEFSASYVADNEKCGLTADHIAFLSYAVLMLHTDRHNQCVRSKMSRNQFVKLFDSFVVADDRREIFDRRWLETIYDDISSSQFRLLLTDADVTYQRLAQVPSPSRFGMRKNFPDKHPSNVASSISVATLEANNESTGVKGISYGRGRLSNVAAVASPATPNHVSSLSRGIIRNPAKAEKLSRIVNGATRPSANALSLYFAGKFSLHVPPHFLSTPTLFSKCSNGGFLRPNFIFVTPDGQWFVWTKSVSNESSLSQASFVNGRNRIAIRDILDVSLTCSSQTKRLGFRFGHSPEQLGFSIVTASRTLNFFASGSQDDTSLQRAEDCLSRSSVELYAGALLLWVITRKDCRGSYPKGKRGSSHSQRSRAIGMHRLAFWRKTVGTAAERNYLQEIPCTSTQQSSESTKRPMNQSASRKTFGAQHQTRGLQRRSRSCKIGNAAWRSPQRFYSSEKEPGNTPSRCSHRSQSPRSGATVATAAGYAPSAACFSPRGAAKWNSDCDKKVLEGLADEPFLNCEGRTCQGICTNISRSHYRAASQPGLRIGGLSSLYATPEIPSSSLSARLTPRNALGDPADSRDLSSDRSMEEPSWFTKDKPVVCGSKRMARIRTVNVEKIWVLNVIPNWPLHWNYCGFDEPAYISSGPGPDWQRRHSDTISWLGDNNQTEPPKTNVLNTSTAAGPYAHQISKNPKWGENGAAIEEKCLSTYENATTTNTTVGTAAPTEVSVLSARGSVSAGGTIYGSSGHGTIIAGSSSCLTGPADAWNSGASKRSSSLPSSFAARLDWIRSLWVREPDNFARLMSGAVRVPCSDSASAVSGAAPPTYRSCSVAGDSTSRKSTSMLLPHTLQGNKVMPLAARIRENSNPSKELDTAIPPFDPLLGLGKVVYPEPSSFWSPEFLRLPSPFKPKGHVFGKARRWRLGATEAQQRSFPSSSHPVPSLFATVLPQKKSGRAILPVLPESILARLYEFPQLQSMSSLLLSLWWLGLPPKLRPVLWLICCKSQSSAGAIRNLNLVAGRMAGSDSTDSGTINEGSVMQDCFETVREHFQARRYFCAGDVLAQRSVRCGWLSRLSGTETDLLTGLEDQLQFTAPAQWHRTFAFLSKRCALSESRGGDVIPANCHWCREFSRSDQKCSETVFSEHASAGFRPKPAFQKMGNPTIELNRRLVRRSSAPPAPRRRASCALQDSYSNSAEDATCASMKSCRTTTSTPSEGPSPHMSDKPTFCTQIITRNRLPVLLRSLQCGVVQLLANLGNTFPQLLPLKPRLMDLCCFCLAHFSCVEQATSFIIELMLARYLPVGDFFLVRAPLAVDNSCKRTLIQPQEDSDCSETNRCCCPMAMRRRRLLCWLQLFQACFAAKLPALFRHFRALELTPEFYLPRWFSTLFVGILPVHLLSILWDRLLAAKSETLVIQIALGFLRYHELFLVTSSFMGCLEILKSRPGYDAGGAEEALFENSAMNLSTTVWNAKNHHRDVVDFSALLNDVTEDIDSQRFLRCVDACALQGDIGRIWMTLAEGSWDAAVLQHTLEENVLF